jgi:hypothetical protein
MKYSKRDREQAALQCAICSSNFLCMNTVAAGEDLGHSSNSLDLACLAWQRAALDVSSEFCIDVTVLRAKIYAEAEALIRTGWEP